MTRLWSRCLVVALLVLGTVVAGGRVAAQQNIFPLPGNSGIDYVCLSTLFPPTSDPSAGNHGYLIVWFSSGPSCSEGTVGGAYLFSEGATSSLSDSRYLYSASGLNTYALMMQSAASSGRKVQWVRCTPTKDNCLRYVTIRSEF